MPEPRELGRRRAARARHRLGDEGACRGAHAGATRRAARLAAAALALAAAGQSYAAGPSYDRLPQDPNRGYESPAQWSEGGSELPAPPLPQHRLALTSRLIDSSYRYFIDEASTSMNPDKVFRYSVTVVSDGGITSTFFEGIRCESKEYKTYAYLFEGEFHPTTAAQWKRIVHGPGAEHRSALYQEIVCRNPRAPASREAILGELEHRDRNARRTTPLFRRDPLVKRKD